jgi:hypothetical protein
VDFLSYVRTISEAGFKASQRLSLFFNPGANHRILLLFNQTQLAFLQAVGLIAPLRFFCGEIAMHKIVVAAAAALMLTVGTTAYAQQPPAGPDFGRRPQFAPEDRALSSMRALLRFTPGWG